MNRADAFVKFFNKLGDPAALGLLGFLVLLLAVAGIIMLVNLRRRKKEDEGRRGARRGR